MPNIFLYRKNGDKMKAELHEKMVEYGVNSLNNEELLTIIVKSNSAAKAILNECPQGSISYLGENNLQSLKNNGLDERKAVQLCAAIELGKRIRSEKIKMTMPTFDRSEVVANFVMEEMCYLPQEEFRVCLINTKCRLIAIKTISIGTLDASLARPREIYKCALRYNAASIILLHNHPSGDPEPSEADIKVTKKIANVGEELGIPVLDHIIIGDGRFVSLSERGYV